MRENCTYGSLRGSRRKTAKHVLRVAEDRAGVPDNKGRPALLYTPLSFVRIVKGGNATERSDYENTDKRVS